uniref:HD domain-containing protein n=1 Tax=Brassica oleracea var. oleracea TaxID=109376 RepID=A0A0D3D6Q9_BRAOL
MEINSPATRVATLASASKKFLCIRNPTPIVAVRCQKHVSESTVSSSIDFSYTTKRKGWINQGTNGPESIAVDKDRAQLGMVYVYQSVSSKEKLRKSLRDAIVGDITPSDGEPKKKRITELWLEYENNASLEANLVKDLDKVEMILQAPEYEVEHGKVLDEFFISTAGKFQTEIGMGWAAGINARRKCQ